MTCATHIAASMAEERDLALANVTLWKDQCDNWQTRAAELERVLADLLDYQAYAAARAPADVTREWRARVSRARAALAKAEGRS
jgi:hypothetical protein